MPRSKNKKTELLAYRLSEGERQAFYRIAHEMRIKPAALTGIVMARFAETWSAHGNRLVWPPELNYRAGRE